MRSFFNGKVLSKTILSFVTLALLFLFNQSYAVTRKEAVEKWLKDKEYNNVEYEYYDNGNLTYGYAITLPQLPNDGSIIHKNGMLYYRTTDSSGAITGEEPLALTMDVNIGGTPVSITVDSRNLQIDSEGNLKLIIVDKLDAEKKAVLNNGTLVVNQTQLQNMKVNKITENGSASSGDTTEITKFKRTSFDKKGQNIFKKFWEWIKSVGNAIKDWVFDQLTGIVNKLLLAIADGIKDLIDGIVGEDITIARVVYNKSDKLNIDYWNPDANDTKTECNHEWYANASTSSAYKRCKLCGKTVSITAEELAELTANPGKKENANTDGYVMKEGLSSAMRPIITYWYNVFRGFGIIFAIIMFLYTGIRILLASTAESFEESKKRLYSWFMGLIILFFFPYVIKYTVILNSCMVELVATKGEVGTEAEFKDGGQDTMEIVRVLAGTTANSKYPDAEPMNSLPMTIVYLVLLGQLIALIIIYYKRAFMVAFLITMFPIIATYNMWETTHSGKGNSLKTWTKMFVELVFVQLIHACVYAVLIEGSFDTFDFVGGNGNFILYILCVRFMFSAEKVIKGLFAVRTTSNTLGDAVNAGAAAMTMVSSVKSLVKVQPSKANVQDKSDEKELTETVNNMQTNAVGYRVNSRNATGSSGGTGGAGSTGRSGSLGGTGLPGGAGGTGGTGGAPAPAPNLAMLEAQKAANVLGQIALKSKNSGFIHRAVHTATNVAFKTAGAGIGLAMGLAMGSPTKALSNAVMMKELGGTVASGVNKITGVAMGRFSGAYMRARFDLGGYDSQLQQAGVDTEVLYNNAKAQLIKDALATQMSGTRRGGRALGNVKFTSVIERKSRS